MPHAGIPAAAADTREAKASPGAAQAAVVETAEAQWVAVVEVAATVAATAAGEEEMVAEVAGAACNRDLLEGSLEVAAMAAAEEAQTEGSHTKT